MSVLFTVPFEGTTIHVLHLRGRVAFLARELGQAAGHNDNGQAFVTLICREWGASFEEDDDIAQLVGQELDTLKREVPLPADTTTALVLFPSGVDRALERSRARHATSLRGFLHSQVLSRVVTFSRAKVPDDDGTPPAAIATPNVPLTMAVALANQLGAVLRIRDAEHRLADALCDIADLRQQLRAETARADRFERQIRDFNVLTNLANELHDELNLISEEQFAALKVEAAEVALGRPIRTSLPAFDDNDTQPLAS